jgi:hypothetical protein
MKQLRGILRRLSQVIRTSQRTVARGHDPPFNEEGPHVAVTHMRTLVFRLGRRPEFVANYAAWRARHGLPVHLAERACPAERERPREVGCVIRLMGAALAAIPASISV